MTWNPLPGPVQYYALERSDYDSETAEMRPFEPVAQISANQTSYQDTGSFSSFVPNGDKNDGSRMPGFRFPDNSVYRLTGVYSGGSSLPTQAVLETGEDAFSVDAKLIRNSTGRWQVICSALPPGVKTLRLNWFAWNYFWDFSEFLSSEDVAVTNFTAGVYVIPDEEVVSRLAVYSALHKYLHSC